MLDKAEVALDREHEVVEEGYAEELSRLGEAACPEEESMESNRENPQLYRLTSHREDRIGYANGTRQHQHLKPPLTHTPQSH